MATITLDSGNAHWAGRPNKVWQREREYYRSFPNTVERGNKKWYVDIIYHDSQEKVIFGRDVSATKRIWAVYYEKAQSNSDWKELLDRADKAIKFLP